VFAGALSALMSTASGALLAVATLLANDVYRRFVAPGLGDGAFLRATRVIATTAGVLTVVIGLTIGDVVRALDISYTLLSGSLFVPVMAGIFWRRAGAVAALASMGASFVAGIAAMAVYGIDSGKPILVGILVSAVTLLAVALARRPAPAQPGGEHE
jgi:SSS family solute:Na+ symporter